MKTPLAPLNGRFKKGNSGNPSGRPIGSRNKSTLLSEQIIGDDLQAITRKLTELAKAGNIHAIKLCLERMIPVRKERTIELPVEPVENPNDSPISHRSILTAIGNSTITPAEGLDVSNVVTRLETSVETKELALRVKALEAHLDEIRRFEKAGS